MMVCVNPMTCYDKTATLTILNRPLDWSLV